MASAQSSSSSIPAPNTPDSTLGASNSTGSNVEAAIRPGEPKIVVPVLSSSLNQLIGELELANQSQADLIEWRVDFFLAAQGDVSPISDRLAELNTVSRIVAEIAHKPVLATCRTSFEGGQYGGAEAEYLQIVTCLAEHFSFIDVEVNRSGAAELIRQMANRVTVVGSFHDFSATGSCSELTEIFDSVKKCGAQIVKVAVMPTCPEDVQTLIAAATSWRAKNPDPMIAISMGDLGKITRMDAPKYGFLASFASLTQTSAPGQIPVGQLHQHWVKAGYRT